MLAKKITTHLKEPRANPGIVNPPPSTQHTLGTMQRPSSKPSRVQKRKREKKITPNNEKINQKQQLPVISTALLHVLLKD